MVRKLIKYNLYFFSLACFRSLNMRTTTLAATIFLAAFATGYDADTKDATGCPTVFQGKCHCNKQRYHRWKPDVETFVVNCTNTRFNSKLAKEWTLG